MDNGPRNPIPAPTVQWALFGWRGRIGRQTYILGQLFMIALFSFIVARLMAVDGDESATVFWGLMMFALMGVSAWSMLALTVKRLHDLGQPGVLCVLLFVPTINAITVLVLMALPSSPKPNEHGPPPFGPPAGGGRA
jgi:uncharacterized membrane protein YhaH (DUF805 family)